MRVTYYPGCSLEGAAKDYADSVQGICEFLGIQLEEVPDWNCCGATAAHSINHGASIDLPGRNLELAGRLGNADMLVPCPLCYNRLKTAVHELGGDGHAFRTRLPRHLPKLWDLANFFATDAMIEKLAGGVAKPLTGLKVVSYHGCMASRPPEITGAADCENPQSLDKIMKSLGASVIDWPYKTDCCGASLMISRNDMGIKMAAKLLDMAQRLGAHAIVVSCQMCQANLDMYQERIESETGRFFSLPIVYFTELIGVASGLPGAQGWLSRHFVDPIPLLRRYGLV